MRAGHNRVRVMQVGLISLQEIGTGLFEPIETQWEGWSLMIFCARATRGRGLPSPGLMARLGVPVGGRVRKSRAVGDQSSPPSSEMIEEL